MDHHLPRVTARLLTSYRHVGGINNIEVVNVPSKRAIGAMCEELLQLLFPGFHDEKPVLSDELQEITERRVMRLTDRLSEEILKSLRTRLPGGCSRERAHEIVFSFLDELPAVRELLRTDVEAAYEGDPAASFSLEEIIVAYPSIETVAIQRLAHVLYKMDLPLVPRMMTEWAHARTGIDIHPGAQIGPYFFHRPRHGRRHRRNERHRRVGQALPGRVARGTQLPEGRQGPARQGRQAAPGPRRPRHDLREHDRARRGHARRCGQHGRGQRVPHPERPAGLAGDLRGNAVEDHPEEGDERSAANETGETLSYDI